MKHSSCEGKKVGTGHGPRNRIYVTPFFRGIQRVLYKREIRFQPKWRKVGTVCKSDKRAPFFNPLLSAHSFRHDRWKAPTYYTSDRCNQALITVDLEKEASDPEKRQTQILNTSEPKIRRDPDPMENLDPVRAIYAPKVGENVCSASLGAWAGAAPPGLVNGAWSPAKCAPPRRRSSAPPAKGAPFPFFACTIRLGEWFRKCANFWFSVGGWLIFMGLSGGSCGRLMDFGKRDSDFEWWWFENLIMHTIVGYKIVLVADWIG